MELIAAEMVGVVFVVFMLCREVAVMTLRNVVTICVEVSGVLEAVEGVSLVLVVLEVMVFVAVFIDDVPDAIAFNSSLVVIMGVIVVVALLLGVKPAMTSLSGVAAEATSIVVVDGSTVPVKSDSLLSDNFAIADDIVVVSFAVVEVVSAIDVSLVVDTFISSVLYDATAACVVVLLPVDFPVNGAVDSGVLLVIAVVEDVDNSKSVLGRQHVS